MTEQEHMFDDVMREMINEWKAAHKEKPRDLDFEMLCEILKHVNGNSLVKIACNPLDEDRDWIYGTECFSVGKVEVDDQGRLLIHMRRDKSEYTVDKMRDALHRLRKNSPSRSSGIMAKVSEKKVVQLTDVYSHALMKDHWAGLPSDLVLAYYEKEEKEKKDE